MPRKVQLFRDWLRAEVPDSAAGYVDQARRGHGGGKVARSPG